jgi:uncharacterized delta-60 repeat protein
VQIRKAVFVRFQIRKTLREKKIIKKIKIFEPFFLKKSVIKSRKQKFSGLPLLFGKTNTRLADRKNRSLKMDCRQNFFMNRGNIEMLKNYQKKFIKSGFVLCTILVCIAIFSLEFAQMSSAKTRANEGNSESVAPAFVDPAFNPILGSANAQWLISRVQPDGKILAAGLVNVVNGTNRNSLARFNADGTMDTTFNTGSGANNIIYGIDLQPDGKILVSGAFTTFNGVTVGRIARLNADGSLDQNFNAPGVGLTPTAAATSKSIA